MLMAAFKSRSTTFPHSQRMTLTDNDMSWITPQPEQVLLLGKKRSTTTICVPVMAALYSSCSLNSPKLESITDRAKQRFFTMPLTFRSSMPIIENSVTRRVVSLCSASLRMFAIRRCLLESLAFAFCRFALPFCFRLNERLNLRNRELNARCGFAPTIT